MPSINRPTWRGVSTTRIEHITEELSRLERSTLLMRQNLDNTNANRINIFSEPIHIGNSDLVGVTEGLSDDNDDLPSVLQSLEASSEELKLKIRSVLKSNIEFKTEMKTYFEQSEAWNLAFQQESKKIEAEIEAVTSPTMTPEPVSGTLTTIVTRKARYWYNFLGSAGRNAVFTIRSKWEGVEVELREFLLHNNENNNHDISAYAVIPHM